MLAKTTSMVLTLTATGLLLLMLLYSPASGRAGRLIYIVLLVSAYVTMLLTQKTKHKWDAALNLIFLLNALTVVIIIVAFIISLVKHF